MTDYRERIRKNKSTSADSEIELDDDEENQRIVVNVNELASKVLVSSITGVATAFAIRAFMGDK